MLNITLPHTMTPGAQAVLAAIFQEWKRLILSMTDMINLQNTTNKVHFDPVNTAIEDTKVILMRIFDYLNCNPQEQRKDMF